MSDKEFVDSIIELFDTHEEFDRIVKAYIIYYNL